MNDLSLVQEVMPFVVIGLVAGSLYGLAATGLVLTYKTSGIFNFAHGAIGSGAAYVFYDLRDRQDLPGGLALAIVVLVVSPLAGLLLSRLTSRLVDASTARRVVATVGVLLAIQGAVQLRYGVAPLPLESPFPTSTFRVLDVNVGYDQLVATLLAITGVISLAILFRSTKLGLKMRAVVDNSELLDLGGNDSARVRDLSWMIGAAFAGLSGVLLATAVGLDALLLTLVVVQAFGAAAIGRFDSTTVTFVGGVLIGVVAAVLNAPILVRNLSILEDLPPLDTTLPFVVLFGVLVLTRKGAFSDAAQRRAPYRPPPLSSWTLGLMGLAALGAVAMLPFAYESRVPVFTLGAVFVTVYASLYLLVEVSNQVSLCQVTFVAIGATTFAHLTTGAGLPWAVGVAGVVAVAIPIGAIVAIPAIRLSGLFLALATLGFGILVEKVFYNRAVMFGAIGQRDGTRPDLLGLDGDRGYFFLCLAVAVAAIVSVLAIRRARLGRLLGALADSPTALATHGAAVNVTRVLVFCISAAMAAIAGALLVGVTGSVSSSGVAPSALVPFNSLLWLAVLAFVGRSPVVAPVLAAAFLIVLPSYVTDPDTVQIQTLLFGLLAMGTAILGPDVGRWMQRNGSAHRDRAWRSPVADRSLPLEPTETAHG